MVFQKSRETEHFKLSGWSDMSNAGESPIKTSIGVID